MNKISNIFDRILYIIEKKGLKNVPELAKKMGYESPQKIYRLKKKDSKPSYDIIRDFSNEFEDLSLKWFLTGDGNPFNEYTDKRNLQKGKVSEPQEAYELADEVQQLKNRIKELEIEKKSLLLALREIGSGTFNKDKSDS